MVALHNEDSQVLLVAGVMAGWQHDESTSLYTTDNLYRFLRHVEAPTADAAELLVLEQFERDGKEMAADMEEYERQNASMESAV
ncbi:hypothetical protein ACWC5I_01955 [Kitasatospora sp. NPDC001574]